ncbi:MAG: hypothetical protein HGB12_06960 [Bacteroidetes bacterium]|nr:hypothetical protein [Bacteroidota bacterium]
MLIIADNKIPAQAKANLMKYGKLALLETSGITEESISGHPDIFFCKVPGKLVVAPNTPPIFKNTLSKNNISFIDGIKNIDAKYPSAAHYNVVITGNILIHRTDITDFSILEQCKSLIKVYVKQGFTRCSLLALNNNFITSDEGIYKTLEKLEYNCLYVKPNEIILHRHKHGFFGGACGVYENKIFILGSLKYFSEGEKVKLFVKNSGYEIIELYEGPLFDGGSILFLEI